MNRGRSRDELSKSTFSPSVQHLTAERIYASTFKGVENRLDRQLPASGLCPLCYKLSNCPSFNLDLYTSTINNTALKLVGYTIRGVRVIAVWLGGPGLNEMSDSTSFRSSVLPPGHARE